MAGFSRRLIELFESFGLPLTVLLNSACYDHCPELVSAFSRCGDEIVAHGRTNSEHPNGMSEEEERATIAEVTAARGQEQEPRTHPKQRLHSAKPMLPTSKSTRRSPSTRRRSALHSWRPTSPGFISATPSLPRATPPPQPKPCNTSMTPNSPNSQTYGSSPESRCRPRISQFGTLRLMPPAVTSDHVCRWCKAGQFRAGWRAEIRRSPANEIKHLRKVNHFSLYGARFESL